MSTHLDTTLRLEPGGYYHIFNRGNRGIQTFYQERNFEYFLMKYYRYLFPYVDTFAYALIPNHFHFLIKVKSHRDILRNSLRRYGRINKPMRDIVLQIMESKLKPHIKSSSPLNSTNIKNNLCNMKLSQLYRLIPIDVKIRLSSWIISDSFRRLFMSYCKAINKQEGITGSLFQKNFRRKKIDSYDYFLTLIKYINKNPLHHGLSSTMEEYPWCSFYDLMNHQYPILKSKKIYKAFGGKTKFKLFHSTTEVIEQERERFIPLDEI